MRKSLAVAHFLLQFLAETAFKWVVVERQHGTGATEEGVLFVDTAEVERHHSAEPAGEMDKVGLPCQLADSLQGAAAEEKDALVVGGAQDALLVVDVAKAIEILLVVDEVNLHPRRGDGAHLDDELVVAVVDDKVHARQPDDFVQLMLAFVDLVEPRHEDANLPPDFLGVLGEETVCDRSLGFG